MTVVYLDSVFAFNALLDYLLVLSAARLSGIPLRRGRYLLCGLLGGMYAAAVFLPGCGFLAAVPVKAAVGILLALTAFGGERYFLRLAMLTFGLACALAGAVLALGLLTGQDVPSARGIYYTDISAGTLLISAVGAYAMLAVVFRAAAAHGLRGERIPVRVHLLGQTVALTALRDTGSGLRDASGDPVLTVESHCLPQLRAVWGLSPAEALPRLRQGWPELRPQLLPIRTAAGSGLLLSVRSDWTEVGGARWPGLRIALTDTDLGSGYTALWGGGEGRGDHDRMAAAAAVPLGTVPRAGDPLHRRQRYAASASEPGAGGGAAGPPDGGGRPQGADRA